jgi:hypothetical protein
MAHPSLTCLSIPSQSTSPSSLSISPVPPIAAGMSDGFYLIIAISVLVRVSTHFHPITGIPSQNPSIALGSKPLRSTGFGSTDSRVATAWHRSRDRTCRSRRSSHRRRYSKPVPLPSPASSAPANPPSGHCSCQGAPSGSSSHPS